MQQFTQGSMQPFEVDVIQRFGSNPYETGIVPQMGMVGQSRRF